MALQENFENESTQAAKFPPRSIENTLSDSLKALGVPVGDFDTNPFSVSPHGSIYTHDNPNYEACKSGIDIPYTGGDSGGDTGLNHAEELQNSNYGPES